MHWETPVRVPGIMIQYHAASHAHTHTHTAAPSQIERRHASGLHEPYGTIFGAFPSCVLRTGEDLEDLVEQQLWGDAASASAGEDGSSTDGGGGSSGSIVSSLAARAADDKGLAAWDVNMKALKTVAYDLGRLPNEVRQTVSPGLLLLQPTHNTLTQTSLLEGLEARTPELVLLELGCCKRHAAPRPDFV